MPWTRCPAARHLCRRLATLVADLAAQLLDAETELMEHDHCPIPRADERAPPSAQLHRMVGGLRATMQRMERDPACPQRSAHRARMLPRIATIG
jgi:hypothetical protein